MQQFQITIRAFRVRGYQCELVLSSSRHSLGKWHLQAGTRDLAAVTKPEPLCSTPDIQELPVEFKIFRAKEKQVAKPLVPGNEEGAPQKTKHHFWNFPCGPARPSRTPTLQPAGHIEGIAQAFLWQVSDPSRSNMVIKVFCSPYSNHNFPPTVFTWNLTRGPFKGKWSSPHGLPGLPCQVRLVGGHIEPKRLSLDPKRLPGKGRLRAAWPARLFRGCSS